MMYDEEYMIDDIEATFKEKLNDKIAAINTEKGAVAGDDLFLEDIQDNDYIFETLDSRLNNHRGFFVLFGLVETEATDPNIESFVDGVTITFQVGTFDKGEQHRRITLTKLLRYRRALKQVVMCSPDMFRGYAKPLMASLKPDAFPYDNRRTILKIGVDIKASITGN